MIFSRDTPFWSEAVACIKKVILPPSASFNLPRHENVSQPGNKLGEGGGVGWRRIGVEGGGGRGRQRDG